MTSDTYHLAFKNGSIAIFIPGTATEFTLGKYKEELGKDYKGITMYLISGEELGKDYKGITMYLISGDSGKFAQGN